MDCATAVVLPAAFLLDLTGGIFARDSPGEVTPERRVHGVEVTAGGVGPACRPFRTDRVGGKPVEVLGGRVVIGIAGEDLPLAVDENLLGFEVRRDLGLKDAVLVGRPGEGEFDPAAEDRAAFAGGLIHHRCGGRAGVGGGEHHGLRQIINPVGKGHGDRAVSGQTAGGLLGGGEALQRCGTGAGGGVLAAGSDEEFGGGGGHRCLAGDAE